MKNKKLFIVQITGILLVLFIAIFAGFWARADAIAFRGNALAVGSEALVPPVIAAVGFLILYKISEALSDRKEK